MRRVRAILEDDGGQFAGLVVIAARAKARSVLLDQSNTRAVIAYHSTMAART